MQLCEEHGISNDGILEDFATQARSVIFMIMDAELRACYSFEDDVLCSDQPVSPIYREATGRMSSSIRQTTRGTFPGRCCWTWSLGGLMSCRTLAFCRHSSRPCTTSLVAHMSLAWPGAGLSGWPLRHKRSQLAAFCLLSGQADARLPNWLTSNNAGICPLEQVHAPLSELQVACAA